VFVIDQVCLKQQKLCKKIEIKVFLKKLTQKQQSMSPSPS